MEKAAKKRLRPRYACVFSATWIAVFSASPGVVFSSRSWTWTLKTTKQVGIKSIILGCNWFFQLEFVFLGIHQFQFGLQFTKSTSWTHFSFGIWFGSRDGGLLGSHMKSPAAGWTEAWWPRAAVSLHLWRRRRRRRPKGQATSCVQRPPQDCFSVVQWHQLFFQLCFWWPH